MTFNPCRLLYIPELPYSVSSNMVTMKSPMLTSALSEAAFLRSINTLFNTNGNFPLHSLLSDAATEYFSSSPTTPSFRGFASFEEKLYIILIVALLAIATVFMVVVISVCSEDKIMRMSDEPKINIKASKGPSLLTPIADKKFTGSYTPFQKLKKRHTQDSLSSKGAGDSEAHEQSSNKYIQLLDQGSPVMNSDPSKVTHTEITLADLTEP